MGDIYTETLAAIVNGELDDKLSALNEQIRDRHLAIRRMRSRTARATLKVGDRIRIVDTVRPKYLAGSTGRVTGVSGPTTFLIQLDNGPGRFGGTIKVQASLVMPA